MSGTIGNAVGGPARRRLPLGGWERALLGLLAVVVAVLSLTVDGFFPDIPGFLAVSESFLPFGLVALGLAVVILTGGIDLSVGSIASLSAIIAATLWHGLHLDIWIAAGVGIAAGAALGTVNGLLITRLRTEPLIATLATNFIYASVATALAGDNPPSGFPDSFNALGIGTIGPVPIQLVLFAVLAVVFGLLVGRTPFGRRVVMVGYNPEAARYSGIRVERTVTFAYVLSGVTAALAGIVLAAYYSAVRPDMGDVLLLTTITMVVLGGVSIFGGEGRITGVVIAVLLLGVIRQGLLTAGFSDMVTTMLTGTVLLAAITTKNALAGRGTGVATLLRRLRVLSTRTAS